MDEILRARLRVEKGADIRLWLLRRAMYGIDGVSRILTRQSFFALREAEELLSELDGRKGPDLVQTLLARNGGTTLSQVGLENVPVDGPVVIGSTHPIGTFDFIAHAGVLWERRPDLMVVANREAERFLGPERIIAVDLNSKDKVLTARQTLIGMQAHLERGGALLVFGSGRVADMAGGLLFEPPWRTGITRITQATGAPIVPASTNMRNSRNYYRTRKLAQTISGGNEYFGRAAASLRYVTELIEKLGGQYEVHYGEQQEPGTAPEVLKELAEGLVPGLYR